MSMYEADRLDSLRLAPFQMAEQQSARQRHAGEYIALPGASTIYARFDASRPPFDDLRVRQAVVLATDRQTLANVALGGFHSPAMGGFVPPGIPAHSAGIGLPCDPEEARRLLAQAGYPGGRGFPMVKLAAWDTRRAWADHVAQQVRENLSVELAVDTVEWPAHIARMRSGWLTEISLGAWEADYPDPDSFLRVALLRESRWWTHPSYNQLVEKARHVMDHSERMRLYRQAERILMNEAAIMPLTYSTEQWLVKPWLRNYPPQMEEVGSWADVIIEPH
jgi:oligopeptide transport system substrate-binding protein